MLKDNLNEISVISNKDANERALSLIPKIKDIKCNIKSSDTFKQQDASNFENIDFLGLVRI